MSFRALYLTKGDAGVHPEIRLLDESALPTGDVLIHVSHSTLNYKDALAITNGGPSSSIYSFAVTGISRATA
jgi:acrylyl-CoA reductase (NADPH)